MQSTITEQQRQAIALKLATMHLPAGLGDEHNACSIAAINLTLSGELSDTIPPCMSEVIGKWVIRAQDAMPDTMRNSSEWKRLLPLAAGTGREREQERLTIIMNWLWESVLPVVQPVADSGGYGEQWKEMLRQRTARDAARAADAAADAAYAYVAYAYAAARAAARAADAAYAHAAYAYAAADAADAAYAYAAADAAADADAAAAAYAYAADADAVAWTTFNPCGLLDKLIKLEH